MKIDTREQKPWVFRPSLSCEGSTICTLKTGDYTLQGYEDLLCLERKGTPAELIANLIEKRFDAELERMGDFKWPFIICEFLFENVIDFPINSGIPRNRWARLRLTAEFFHKRIAEIQMQYKAKLIFAGDRGKHAAIGIFKRAMELCPERLVA